MEEKWRLDVVAEGHDRPDGRSSIVFDKDGISILNFLFLGGETPTCLEAANANDDAAVNITDGIYILNFLFLGGTEPATPGPESCGTDPQGSTDVTCLEYASC